MSTFYSIYVCIQVRENAKKLNMEAHPLFWLEPAHILAKIMNGCGPDSWTDSMRSSASWVYRNYPECIAIHDFDFEHSDGDLETLKIVNKRFFDNAKKKLDVLYPVEVYTWKAWKWKNVHKAPIRAWAYGKIEFAYFALKNKSEEAWKSAHERLNSDKKIEKIYGN